MIDVHCHLNFHAFEKDCDEVIKKAFDDGVQSIINVGTKIDSSKRAVELSEKYKDLYAIIGIHPHHADKVQDDFINELGKNITVINRIGIDLPFFGTSSSRHVIIS